LTIWCVQRTTSIACDTMYGLTYLQLFILILTDLHANDEQLITNERRVNNERSIR